MSSQGGERERENNSLKLAEGDTCISITDRKCSEREKSIPTV